MRLGVLTTSYPRNNEDSAGLFVAQLAHWLANEGHRIDLLAPEGARPQHPSITLHPIALSKGQRLFSAGGAPDRLLAGGDAPLAARAAAWAEVPVFTSRQWFQYRRLQRDWDGLIAHWLLPAALITGRFRRPQVVIAHGSDVHLLSRLPGRHVLLDYMAGSACRLVVTHAGLRATLRACCRSARSRAWVDAAQVIPMGIEPFVRPDACNVDGHRERHGLRGKKIALFMGRLIPLKGVRLLIESLRHLPDIRLVVMGQGPDRASLGAWARRLDVPVIFAGECHGEEKRLWLSAADYYVHPALCLPGGRTDSAPVSVMEAMSAGLPVVATEVGGLPQIIEHRRDGLLVRPNDPAVLGESLRELMQNPQWAKSLGEKAARTAAKFHWQATGPRILRLLEPWRVPSL
jgi:glycosyltransferase involved in cell wall biosynthesis